MKFSFKALAIALVTGIVLLTNTADASVGPYVKFSHAESIADHNQKSDRKRDRENNDKKDVDSFRVLLIPQKNGEAVRMFLEKEVGKRLTIRLKSPDGYPLIHFLTDKKPVSIYRKFNFIEAQEGVYTFEVSDGKQTISKKIVLQRTKAEVQTRLAVE